MCAVCFSALQIVPASGAAARYWWAKRRGLPIDDTDTEDAVVDDAAEPAKSADPAEHEPVALGEHRTDDALVPG